MADDAVLRQKVETLDGSRALVNRAKAAVRIEDIKGLLAIPTALKAQKVTGTVSVAAYNNLVDDVTALRDVLAVVATALQGRLGRS
jgi:hypothetical protein